MTRASLALAAAVAFSALPASAAGKSAYQHYLKALLHANQSQYAEAMKEYEAALALDPQSATMYQQAAQLALEMGDMGRALELAARFAELAPENPEAHFLVGQVRWARGEGDPARAAFEKALQLKPGYAEALFALGNLLGATSPEEARKYLERYVQENPDDSSDALFQIALLASRAGEDSEAEKKLKQAIVADTDNMQARHALAQLYEARRDTEAALAAYEAIVEKDPRNVVLLNHVGEILVLKDRNSDAKGWFQRAKEVAPSHPGTCLWLALMAEEAGDFAEAARQVRESAALGEDAALNLRLSYYLTQDGKLKEAVAVLEDAQRRWPENDEIAYFLGLGYDDLKNPAKAAAMMEKVLKLKPGHRDALFQLGSVREKQGDMAGAEAAFQELIQGHPSDAAALNYLGYSLADRGLRLAEAEAYIRRALAVDPQSGAYMDSLGWVRFKRGDTAGALEWLRKAADALSGDETVWLHLADALSASGDPAGAWAAVKRAQAGAPENAALAKKASSLESGLSAEDLGGRLLDLQKSLRGRLASYGGPCVIEGSVAGRPLKFNGFFHFRAPRSVDVDVLGPLFVPLFRAGLGGDDSFTMDPLALEGVPPEAARDAVYAALSLLRRWLDGSAFDARPGAFRRSWHKPPRVETASGVFGLDKGAVLVETFRENGAPGLELQLGDVRPVAGRFVPSRLKVSAKGFTLEFRFARPEVRFE